MKTKNQSPFQGEWVVCRTQYKNHKNKWITQKRFRFGNCVWSFKPDSENRWGQGIMIESGSESENYSRKFSFFPEYAQLHIDCSDYSEDGYLFACCEDVYHVTTRKNILILNELSITDDPEYVCRLILKRNDRFNQLAERVLKIIFG